MADPPPPSITSDPFPGPPPPPLLRNPSSSSSSFDASSSPLPSLIPLSSNHLLSQSSLSPNPNPELNRDQQHLETETILSSPSSAYTAELPPHSHSHPIPQSDQQVASPVPSPNPSNSISIENPNDYSTTPLSSNPPPPLPLTHHSSSNTSQSQSNGGIGIGISSSSSLSGTGIGTSTTTTTTSYPQNQSYQNQTEYSSRQERTISEDHQGGGLQQPVVPTEFDEGVLRALCDLDCGMPLLLDRLKQSSASCRETSQFLKKRAVIEEEYARSMSKLVKSSIESYGLSDGKAGSFVNSYLSLLKSHDLLSDNRLKFSLQLSEMSEELSVLGKEVEKTRKSGKELGTRLERGLNEQEGLVEKARIRFDQSAEELERLLLLKSGESLSTTSIPHAHSQSPPPNSSSSSSSSTTTPSGSKGRSLMSKLKGGPKNPAAFARQEEELRVRMGQTSDSFRAATEGMRNHKQEYFNLQLPKLLRSLKEGSDELDLGTQYHLSRYAYLFESLLVTDGLTISPVSIEDGPGVKSVIESIDAQEDFKTFMQQYALNWQMSGQRGPRRDLPNDSIGTYHARPQISPRASSSTLGIVPPTATGPILNPTFGVDLGDQMLRDSVEVPLVLSKCAEAIEREGLDSMGIYRLSGTTSRVQRLKACLDRDLEGTDLLSEDNLSDINDIAAVLKLWFRELPEPLLTWELYHQFIDVSKIENDRLRHIRLHERVNELPDPNYATLKYLMGHLDKVAQRESSNQMSVSNLAIVFGPNLLSPPPPHLAHHFPGPAPPNNSNSFSSQSQDINHENGGNTSASGGGGGSLADTQFKCKCVETILSHYKEIFVE